MDTSDRPIENDQLETQINELNNLKIEIEAMNRLLLEKENVLKRVQSGYSPFQDRIDELKTSQRQVK